MQPTIGLVPPHATLGGSVLLWACIALLVALGLTLVIVSIICGGNRGRGTAEKARAGEGGKRQELLPKAD